MTTKPKTHSSDMEELFYEWWDKDGIFIDPDEAGVPWFYKRQDLALEAFKRAYDHNQEKIKELQARLDIAHQMGCGCIECQDRCKEIDNCQNKIKVLMDALKACLAMTIELSRTMDDGHWYKDDLRNLAKEIQAALRLEGEKP